MENLSDPPSAIEIAEFFQAIPNRHKSILRRILFQLDDAKIRLKAIGIMIDANEIDVVKSTILELTRFGNKPETEGAT